MIIINNVKFAESEDEFTQSLFSNQTCSGFAKRFKRKVLLYDHQKKLQGVITTHGIIGTATQMDGYIWYSYGEPKLLRDFPYAKHYDAAREISISRDGKGLIFK